MENIEDAIERIATNDSQFIMVCELTTHEENEKVYMDGKLLEDGKYFLHLIENKYETLPTIVYYCDWADSETFYYSLGGASSIHQYRKENIHLIFDTTIPENHNMSPEVLKNKCDLLDYRISDFQNDIDLRKKYIGGELVVIE